MRRFLKSVETWRERGWTFTIRALGMERPTAEDCALLVRYAHYGPGDYYVPDPEYGVRMEAWARRLYPNVEAA